MKKFNEDIKQENEIKRLLTSSSEDNIELAYMIGDSLGLDVSALYMEIYKNIFDLITKHNPRFVRGMTRKYKLPITREHIEFFLRRRAWSIKAKGLKKLPEEIGLLNNIEVLMLGKNDLKTLPDSISKLRSLYKLDLSYNKFKEIPKVLYKLKDSLQYLFFDGNPMSDKKVDELRKNLPNTQITFEYEEV